MKPPLQPTELHRPIASTSVHDPGIPAEAIVRATRKRSRYVGVSDSRLVSLPFAFIDRLLPGLMDRFWFRMATEEHYDSLGLIRTVDLERRL